MMNDAGFKTQVQHRLTFERLDWCEESGALPVGVGRLVRQPRGEKAHEGQAVADLEFGLIVGQGCTVPGAPDS